MRIFVLSALGLLLFVSTAAADIGTYAKWKCKAPCAVTYSIDPAFPDSERQSIRQAAAGWANPNISYVEVAAEGQVQVNVGAGGFWFFAGVDHGRIEGVAIYIDYKWFGTEQVRGAYCHELGHGLGFAEPDGDDGSCMADLSFTVPSVMDFRVLADLYPLHGRAAYR
jgi:hypothetical protein